MSKQGLRTPSVEPKVEAHIILSLLRTILIMCCSPARAVKIKTVKHSARTHAGAVAQTVALSRVQFHLCQRQIAPLRQHLGPWPHQHFQAERRHLEQHSPGHHTAHRMEQVGHNYRAVEWKKKFLGHHQAEQLKEQARMRDQFLGNPLDKEDPCGRFFGIDARRFPGRVIKRIRTRCWP